MKTWTDVFGEKGSVSDATISPSDSYASRNKSAFMNWESKSPYSSSNNMLVSGQQTPENQALGEFGYGELIGKQLPNDSVGDVLSSKISGGKTVNPTLAAFSGEDVLSTSRPSSSVVDSHSKDSSLIDLKLGRFPDHKDVQDSSFSIGARILSSSESSKPHKRVRMAAKVNSHTAYCQVYGCNQDLTSSKDYHKRHKVCESHSKTARVIVNGIEQRFCQQCSRFHLLSEFDDGKRSCRKRLAGHNERRRKPVVGNHLGRTGRLLQQYNGFSGDRLHESMLTATSFICQDLLPNGLLHTEKYITNEWGKRIKIEDGTSYSPLSAIPVANGHFHLKACHPSSGIENNARFPHDFGESISVSRPLFQDTLLRSEDIKFFDAASEIQGLSGISDSGRALSLLSSQSQNPSDHLSGIPLARSMVVSGSHIHCNLGQVSENLIGVGLQASTTGVPSKFPSSMNSTEESHFGALLISDGSDAANIVDTEGICQGSEFMNTKDHISCKDGPTIDLLQLSSQLQRVEHQRQSMQANQENEAFCCLRIT